MHQWLPSESLRPAITELLKEATFLTLWTRFYVPIQCSHLSKWSVIIVQ